MREAVLNNLITIYEADFHDLVGLRMYLDFQHQSVKSWLALENIWENGKPTVKDKRTCLHCTCEFFFITPTHANI